jgi:4-aminobutyrate aminotransferase-like enzyme
MNIHQIIGKHTIGDGEDIVIDASKSHGSYLVDKTTGEYLDCSTPICKSTFRLESSQIAY